MYLGRVMGDLVNHSFTIANSATLFSVNAPIY